MVLTKTMNISELSDKELRAVLFEHGQTPGPITGTTRRVYELQLASLINRSPASKKKRRQTLDTALLRSTEKRKYEPRRRSELPPVIACLNLSDYSDTELPVLELTPELSPEPPQSLRFSSPKPKRETRRRSPIRTSRQNTTMFSDSDDSAAVKKASKSGKSGLSSFKIDKVQIALAVGAVVLSVSVYFYMLNSPSPTWNIAAQCKNISVAGISLVHCDKVYTKLAREKRELDLFAGQVECGERNGSLYVPRPDDRAEQQLLFVWREEFNYTIFVKMETLYIEVEGAAEIADFNPVDKEYFYMTGTPQISWLCFVSSTVSKFAYYILISCIFLVMAQIAHKVIKWKRSKARQETGQMYEMIDQIIEELQRNYTKYLADPINYVPYVPIPHARDRLLLPSERSQMKHIWERAVEFIAQHESRVRVEMRRVQNEDYPVWYWLEVTKPPQQQPDSTSSDFLYPDLDSEMSVENKCGAAL